ncbi:MAG: Cytochrome oxidase assembly [Trichoglossum hirsutum]|nr:MAG: Cytochrome oxidase assembly [Trichoglossum hirsutum]
MPTFQSKKYRSSASTNTIGARYRVALNKHPFLLFGLPFITTIVAGSFFLTPATALRYERHDRRVQQMTKDEELGIGKDRRKVDMNEEYYVNGDVQRLAAKDIEDWEQKRVKRLPGEHDGTL